MQVKSSVSGRVIRLKKGKELFLGEELTALSESLEIALARFYRQSRIKIVGPVSSEESTAPGYESRPHLAAGDFGLILTERLFGEDGEQTFFEEFPSAVYFIIEGRWQFAQTSDNFYRLGLVSATANGSGDAYIGIDPIYNRGEIRAALFSVESDDHLYKILNRHYGGLWKADQVLHPETGKYEWLENRTVKSFFPKKNG